MPTKSNRKARAKQVRDLPSETISLAPPVAPVIGGDGPFPIADAPQDRGFLAWHVDMQVWFPAERIFGHLNVDPSLVINMPTGRVWDTKWWREMPSAPPSSETVNA